MGGSRYADSVFINCPFDDAYRGKFRALVFAVLDAGFVPRCSFEINDGGTVRLHAIVELIRQCHYGIHDISRIQLDKNSGLPRFNMPFELGLFHGAKHMGSRRDKAKKCLILEKNSYRYQKFLSDIAGIDVVPHSDSEKKVVAAVRDWLVTASRRSNIPSGNEITSRYRSFEAYMNHVCRSTGSSFEEMPFVELLDNMTDWLRVNQLARLRGIDNAFPPRSRWK